MPDGKNISKDVRACVFVDFWNFQLNWNQRYLSSEAKSNGSGVKCDWARIAPVIREESELLLKLAGAPDAILRITEMRVYASVLRNDPSERRLESWLRHRVAAIPNTVVKVRDRRIQEKTCRCRDCGHEVSVCPACLKRLRSAPEKGVDAAIVTDMMSLAWDDAFDVAILVTQDVDYAPAVRRLRGKGFEVINAAWSEGGRELAAACSGHIALDISGNRLVRTEAAHRDVAEVKAL